MFWCFFLAWPTTYVEWAGIPVVGCVLWRAGSTWRLQRFLLTEPVAWTFGLFWVWQAVSLLWTPDLHVGLKQAGCARWMWVFPALWPALDRRRWLIGAMIAGFLVGNGSQLLHGVGLAFDVRWLQWPRMPDRNSGWWDPVVGGTLLTAALGLHLPVAAFGAGRVRLAGLAGAGVTLVAIFATGTRGAWLAAGALAVIAGVVGVWRARSRARALALCSLVVVLVMGGAWVLARDVILARVDQARSELSAYFEHADVSTTTGTRLDMARRALDAAAAHPFAGVGCGGFGAWLRDHAPTDDRSAPTRGHAHAHNSLLHAAATGGIPSALLAIGALLIGLRNANRARGGGRWGVYETAPLWALMGLALVSPFDSVQVNAQTSALLTTLLALCPSALPRARGWRTAPTEGRR